MPIYVLIFSFMLIPVGADRSPDVLLCSHARPPLLEDCASRGRFLH